MNFNIFYPACFCFVRRRPGPTWPETRCPWDLFKAEPSPTAHSAPDHLNRNRMLAAAVRATLPCQGELLAAWLSQAPFFLWIPRWKWRPCLGHIHGETAESLPPSHLGGPHLTSVGLGRLLQVSWWRAHCWCKECLKINPEWSRNGRCRFLSFSSLQPDFFLTLSTIKLQRRNRLWSPKEKLLLRKLALTGDCRWGQVPPRGSRVPWDRALLSPSFQQHEDREGHSEGG